MVRADFYLDPDPMLNIGRAKFSTPLTNCPYDNYVIKCSGAPSVGEEWGRQGEGRGQEAAGATPSQGEGEIQGEIDPLPSLVFLAPSAYLCLIIMSCVTSIISRIHVM
jgi:hypothetical protein